MHKIMKVVTIGSVGDLGLDRPSARERAPPYDIAAVGGGEGVARATRSGSSRS